MLTLSNVLILPDYQDRKGHIYNQIELQNQTFDRTFYGELNPSNFETVDMYRVSHVIETIKFKPDGLYANIRILATPCGKIAAELIQNGVELQTSIRATGTVNTDNTVTDLKLITFDLIGKQD